jgi:hypothetical protein
MTNEIYERRLSGPVRFSLAAELGQELDGAWWPHNASVVDRHGDGTVLSRV